MRSCRLTRRLGKGLGHKFCEVENYPSGDVAIRDSKRDDLLLCPYTDGKTSGLHVSICHFLLSPMKDGSEGFATFVYRPYTHSRVSLSQYSELWSFEGAVSARVMTWKEVQRIAVLGGGADQNWKTKPYLVLKIGLLGLALYMDWGER